MNLDYKKWLDAPCDLCGSPRRYCAAGGVYQELHLDTKGSAR